MTSAGAERRRSLSSRSETFKFPEFDQPLITRDHLLTHEEENFTGTTPARTSTSARTSTPNAFPKPNGLLHSDTWQPRKENHLAWGNGHINAPTSAPGSRHARQKSLSDAIKTIRTRKGSVSANAQEIAEALKAPVSIKLIVRALYVPLYRFKGTLLIKNVGSVPRLVYELGSDKHLFQIHTQCISPADHPYPHTVRLCFFMVHSICLLGLSLSTSASRHPGT